MRELGNTHAQWLFTLKIAMYYVIQVQTRKEDEMMEDIKKVVSDRYYVEVFSPYRMVLRKYKGEYKEVKERCFPGYLFVETDNIKQLFFDIYNIEGYTRILGREGTTYNFTPLNEDEARMVDILYNAESDRTTPISNIEIAEGDEIRILDGPLASLIGRVKKTNLHKRKVTVVIPLFQRNMEIDVGINIVMKNKRIGEELSVSKPKSK